MCVRVSMHVTVCSRDREREIERETELDAFKSEAREGFGQQIGPREMDLRKESFSKLCGSKCSKVRVPALLRYNKTYFQ